MRDTIKNLIKVFSSNIFNLMVSVFITFLLPNIFEPTDYGYWSLYLLYVSYAGFFIFGYCDGIYLKTIGKRYEEINTSKFKYFLIILVAYLLILFILFLPVLNLLEINEIKRNVIVFSAIGIFLSCINSYYILLNQATQKYNNYAIGNIIEKSVIIIYVIIAILFKIKNIMFIIVFAILGKLLTLVYYLFKNKEIMKSKVEKSNIGEIYDNIKIGFSLTLSSIFSMLMTGLGKFFVEGIYGIESLGYYSFVFSLFSPFTQLIDSVSLIFIPKMKSVSKQKLNNTIIILYKIINYLTPVVLLFYLVGKYIVIFIFKKYIYSLTCFMYLCPIIIIQAKLSIIYNSYYKINRKEKEMLIINFVSLLICAFLIVVGSKLFKDFSGIALMTFLGFYVRELVNKIYFIKKYGIKLPIIDISLLYFSLYFILIVFGVSDIILFLIILVIIIITLLTNINNLKQIIRWVKK